MKIFSKIINYIEATILCIRFPFLYPRNRFTDKHYNNWKIREQIGLFGQILNDKIHVHYIKESDAEDKKGLMYGTMINGQRYIISLYSKNKWCVLKDNKKVFDLSSNIIKGEIKKVGFQNGTQNLYVKCSDDFECKNTFLIPTLSEHIIPKIIIDILNFIENVLGVFHCLTDYTELDAMPDGWRKKFGIQICKDIRKELIKCGWKNLFNYRITQIKEKYGTLRWYDAHVPLNSHIQQIIDKYEDLSYNTCINCGKPATWISKGWISPYCDDCIGNTDNAEKINNN